MLPLAHKTPNTERSVQLFLHSSRQRLAILHNSPPLYPLKLSLLMRDLDPIKYVVPWAYMNPRPNGISIGSSVFAQLKAERPSILQWSALSPLKLPIRMCDLDPHLMHDSLGHTSLKPKRHLDRFSSFCTANLGVSIYFTMGHPFLSQISLFP